MADERELDACYEFAKKLVLDAGKVIAEAIDKDKITESKGIDWDLVTEYDRKVEDVLIKSLSNEYPTHKFIGEETVAREGRLPELTDEPTWIIDPIDGTANFVHRFPLTCISVALLLNKVTEIGIVYNPISDQLFTARRGRGAFLNGRAIATSRVKDLIQALVAMEPWIAKNEHYRANVYRRMHAVIQGTHGIRSLGTAALTLCYVAMGAVEAYHVESVDSWDVAAGKLIIEEAGGVVIDTNGGKLDLMTPRVIAACNKDMADQLVQLFKDTISISLDENLM
ncbi:inositol monophosphatase 2 [Cephus cinctus]|uniref:Inositol-1-monophosphatase n=1 Tax=Cephus cinctus TaxID=211228 RepID=A0AAJ7RPU7_CEPCN|nr:inositol monophosphatase 2 [Cephus cinctus]XP_024944903.1 inositol monophosphatase 2 [Cephus cinctus]